MSDTLKTLPLPSFFLFFVAFLIFSLNSPKIKTRKVSKDAFKDQNLIHQKHYFKSETEENLSGLRQVNKIYWALILTPLITYALIAMSFAPNTYALSFPDARVQFPARVVMTFGLFIEGALLGVLFTSPRSKGFQPLRAKALTTRRKIVTIMLIGAALYPLRGAYQASQQIPPFRAYADAWDTREAYILSQKEKGIMDISLPPIDAMSGVKEFDVSPQHWVNRAVADYYGVDSISVHDLYYGYDE